MGLEGEALAASRYLSRIPKVSIMLKTEKLLLGLETLAANSHYSLEAAILQASKIKLK